MTIKCIFDSRKEFTVKTLRDFLNKFPDETVVRRAGAKIYQTTIVYHMYQAWLKKENGRNIIILD